MNYWKTYLPPIAPKIMGILKYYKDAAAASDVV
jgi:hypothetical protein